MHIIRVLPLTGKKSEIFLTLQTFPNSLFIWELKFFHRPWDRLFPVLSYFIFWGTFPMESTMP